MRSRRDAILRDVEHRHAAETRAFHLAKLAGDAFLAHIAMQPVTPDPWAGAGRRVGKLLAAGSARRCGVCTRKETRGEQEEKIAEGTGARMEHGENRLQGGKSDKEMHRKWMTTRFG